ncbi:GyrI-like domain-containing protein [Paenibacillus sp. NPDC056722]|uniref:GyrI-like domain-containing protein n=1 Tax=Paenibacillus sp. NPDC056722 TaxID=3345924 RepID=UPI003693A503
MFSLNNPEITDKSEFTYIACLEVHVLAPVPSGMTQRTILSSKYAVFTHKGSLNNLKHTYNYIYGVWLPECGYELDELDTIEYYDLTYSVM